ncbi:hypothetical protein ASD90_01420 [Terrabacter sp. Root181]|nr:hypothetical protein ASD90_01420 [Terrabacter sp. Root181]
MELDPLVFLQSPIWALASSLLECSNLTLIGVSGWDQRRPDDTRRRLDVVVQNRRYLAVLLARGHF